MLKALLITGLEKPIDEHITLVAVKSGIAKKVVEAFEILFFNILDRARDGAYIAQIVCPYTRSVEFDEEYFNFTPLEYLLLRAAYSTRDIDFVARLIGMQEEDCKKELATLCAQEKQLASDIFR